jgi:transketolase
MGTTGDKMKGLALFDEIMALKEALNWKSNTELFGQTFVEYTEEGEDESPKAEKRYKEKFKKIFQRINRQESVNETELEKLRAAIYRCEAYKNSELMDSLLSVKGRNLIRKESAEIDKWLLKNDFEA